MDFSVAGDRLNMTDFGDTDSAIGGTGDTPSTTSTGDTTNSGGTGEIDIDRVSDIVDSPEVSQDTSITAPAETIGTAETDTTDQLAPTDKIAPTEIQNTVIIDTDTTDTTDTDIDENKYIVVLGTVVFIMASILMYQRLGQATTTHRTQARTKAFLVRYAGLSSSPLSCSFLADQYSPINKVEARTVIGKRASAVHMLYGLARCARYSKWCETADQYLLVSKMQAAKLLATHPPLTIDQPPAYKDTATPYQLLASLYNQQLHGMTAAMVPVEYTRIVPPADPYYYALFYVLVRMAGLEVDESRYLPEVDGNTVMLLRSALASLYMIVEYYHDNVSDHDQLYLLQDQLRSLQLPDHWHTRYYHDNQRLVQSVIHPIHMNFHGEAGGRRVLLQLANEAFGAYVSPPPDRPLFTFL